MVPGCSAAGSIARTVGGSRRPRRRSPSQRAMLNHRKDPATWRRGAPRKPGPLRVRSFHPTIAPGFEGRVCREPNCMQPTYSRYSCRMLTRLYARVGWRWSARQLKSVEFRGSQLTGVRFQGAELDFVEFEHVNVLRTEFQGASFKDATFQNTLIDNSYIWRTVLKESPLDGVILRRPNEAARIAPGRGAAPTTTAEFVKTRDDLLANISDAEVRASIVGRLARLDPTVPELTRMGRREGGVGEGTEGCFAGETAAGRELAYRIHLPGGVGALPRSRSHQERHHSNGR